MCVCVYLCNRENHIVELESQMCIWTRSFERERGRKNQEQQKKKNFIEIDERKWSTHTHTHFYKWNVIEIDRIYVILFHRLIIIHWMWFKVNVDWWMWRRSIETFILDFCGIFRPGIPRIPMEREERKKMARGT